MITTRFVRVMALPMALCVLPVTQAAASSASLAALVNRPYLDLAEAAPTVSFTRQELETFRKDLAKQRKAEEERLKKEGKQVERRLQDLRDQLKSLNKEASTDTPKIAEVRNQVHCDILRLEKESREKRVELKHGMPVAFDNKLAKVDLIELWPAKKAEIGRILGDGRARQRTYGDVEDIGVRKISEDQEKDIKLGEDALRDMKVQRLMPPDLESTEVKAYVEGIAQRIAANSDVKVPVKLTVLYSQEINAFALPGGYLFVNTGLLDRAETESELAGVIAHELAHVSARHGAQLMKRATIAGIMYQMAQIAVLVGTGGVGSIGTYYLFQAGFLGLGLVLELALLGVSREFEAEADQLGAQYAWKAGYDPRGFISFFDKMASEKGYVKSASFFRTHPPVFERIVSTLSEIEYLPQGDVTVDSSGYRHFKTTLAETLRKEGGRKPGAPSLGREPQCGDDSEKRSDVKTAPNCAACGESE